MTKTTPETAAAGREADAAWGDPDRIECGGLRISWVELGESLYGEDYDENDPEDVEVLRFDIAARDEEGEWDDEAASFCTQFPSTASPEERARALSMMMSLLTAQLAAGSSVRKSGEWLSHVCPEWLDYAPPVGRGGLPAGNGRSAFARLQLAVAADDGEGVRLAVAAGADPERRGDTAAGDQFRPRAAAEAVVCGRHNALRSLLETGLVSVGALEPDFGLGLLHLAAWRGEPQAAALLIQFGADVMAAASSNLTAYHLATAQASPPGSDPAGRALCAELLTAARGRPRPLSCNTATPGGRVSA